MYIYNHIICGGTFDHLHRGHKNFIDLAFKFGKKVTIGIVKNNLNNHKLLSSSIEDHQIRKSAVTEYLKKKNWLKRTRLIPLFDIFGNSLKDKSVEAIVVAKATYKNALLINQLRKKRKLPPLKIIITEDILGDDNKIISSERIRGGEIDRHGHNYYRVFKGKKKLILPDNLRAELRKPIGKVFFGGKKKMEEIAKKIISTINRIKPALVITVGDIITMALLRVGFDPEIKIVDFRSRRENITKHDGSCPGFPSRQCSLSCALPGTLPAVPPVNNNPGTISANVIKNYQLILKKYLTTRRKQLFIIKGEEDLVALPAILLAPLKSIVLYGQMDLGVVMVEVGEEKKKAVEKILGKFN